jgi:hypothetical protein
VLVLNGSYAVSQALLDSFEAAFYVSGTTFAAFATTTQFAYEQRFTARFFEDKPRYVFTRARLGLFVVAYRRLLDWSALDAVCPKCGPLPGVIVCDGIAMGVRKQLLGRMGNDARVIVDGIEAVGRAQSDMSFLAPSVLDARHYKLLIRFIRAPPASACPAGVVTPVNSKDEPPLTLAEADELLAAFSATQDARARSLAASIEHAIKTASEVDGLIACDASLAHFLYPLVTNSASFAAYKPAEHATLVEELLNAPSIAADKALVGRMRALLPWVANFFRDAGLDAVPEFARPALTQLAAFAKTLASWEQKYIVTDMPLDERGPKTLAELKASVVAAETAAAAKIEHALAFTDCSDDVDADLGRGIWVGPGFRRRLNGIFNYSKAPANVGMFQRLCVKEAPTTRSHSPGVFVALCPCGYPVCINLMRSSESPAHVFDFVLSRYPADKMPSMIVYDNACNAYRYAVAREPGAFAGTRFVVDRLHWKNHTRCSTAFRMYEHSVYDDAVRRINSQRAEQ